MISSRKGAILNPVEKEEILESKIRKAVEELITLRREIKRLESECALLKAHVEMLSAENTKAQRVLAEHEQLRRVHNQVTHRVEKALSRLSSLSTPPPELS